MCEEHHRKAASDGGLQAVRAESMPVDDIGLPFANEPQCPLDAAGGPPFNVGVGRVNDGSRRDFRELVQ